MPILTSKYWNWELDHFMKWNERGIHITCKRTPIIHKDTNIVTIGSCFASELADAMERLHLRGNMHPNGLYYNTASIRQEFERIFEPGINSFPEEYWKVEQGYIHPYKSYYEFFKTPEELHKWSAEIDEQADELFQNANLFVITLGLIEVWMDKKTGIVYRQLPPPSIVAEKGISFSRLTVADMLNDLEKIHQIICKYTKAKLIITVSPVPLNATMTDLDVRVANMESKSRIRAAVSEFIEAHPDVYYFHSYEIVATAEKAGDFMLEDGRHVRRNAVDFILNQFLRVFASDEIAIGELDTSWITPPNQLALTPKRYIFHRIPRTRKELATKLKKLKRKIFGAT